MAASSQQSVYLLPLTDDGAPDVPGKHAYIYLPPPSEPAYTLRIVIQGTSSICRQGTFYTNIPESGQQFDRSRFRKFELQPSFTRSIELDIPITVAGCFAFYTSYTPLPEFSTRDVQSPKPTKTPTHYVDVAPDLTLQSRHLPLDALSIFSVISKFMGQDLSGWDAHLRGISGRGYNMVHFTPLMERGDSNSPYSIYDQLKFDPTIFKNGEDDVAKLVKTMESQYGLLGLTDVVWNHTANNSEWLQHHPEAGYNLETAPWLESAEILDSALLNFGADLETHGIPSKLQGTSDLEKLMDGVKKSVWPKIKLWEFYVLDVERDSAGSTTAWREGNAAQPRGGSGAPLSSAKTWSLKQKADWIINHALLGNDRLGERFRRHVSFEASAALLTELLGPFSKQANENVAHEAIREILHEVNSQFYAEFNQDLAAIESQLSNRIKYLRLDSHGPQLGTISKSSPLIESYFTRLPKNDVTKKHNPRSLSLVNNGWIWAADAMKDNAGSSSRAYLRREVIVWGDCVKLRYGTGPKDSPFLWDFVAKYTRLMAKYFTAFRIDNCHSTPIHVAEHMLDEARKVRPNLAVFAELFSGSEDTDFVFVKRLGLSALIREAMQTDSTAALSRLVHMHGGIPTGSFMLDEISNADSDGNSSVRPLVHRIRQSDVHALFFDCTHDNETPAQKRDARDTLPTAALVAMCSCSVGSVMGFDEIYPSLIDLVSETRLYVSASSSGKVEVKPGEGGIGGLKKLLNEIHVRMGIEGFEETYIDHRGQYITVHRVNPRTRKGYFLVAHTAFTGYGDETPPFQPVHLAGSKAHCLAVYQLIVDSSSEAKEIVQKDARYLRGLPSKTVELNSIHVENAYDESIISLTGAFPPGSIALFETSVPAAEHTEGLDTYVTTGAKAAFKDLTLPELNFVLYRCDPEERDTSDGRDGVYTVPGHGPLVYAGLQGWWSILKDIVRNNDLGHPLCQHLRDGPWALDYCSERLERLSKRDGFHRLHEPAKWLRTRFYAIGKLPNYLVPRYFAMAIQTAYSAATERAIEQMSPQIRHGQPFLKELALVSVQMAGISQSGSLWPDRIVPSLAAGLPHFAFDWARCWGRDVFISLRGLLLGTGNWNDAKEHILAFGSVLKHGMIPNLLGSGKITRYNSRDSIWFFLQCIQDYTKIAPSGLSILKESVKRRYTPYDDTWFPWDDSRAYTQTSTIEDIIQEAMQRHASGMDFREANAGPQIDSQMKDEGFNISIRVDWSNGMVFGGNQFNCGTWMDKMGESEKANNKGIPGTPRDGASVEITGLLYSTLLWLSQLHKDGAYRYSGVDMDGPGGSITFEDWAEKIKQNFERCYWVPRDAAEDSQYDINSSIVNRRGIYKDLYRSGKEYEDYQLRPNFPIAMTVAPQLFSPDKALYALWMADTILRGPTGMATLDPSDFGYRPNYVNSEDSTDFRTSKGRNYHSGPEWLWPTGFFLRALLKFDLLRRNTQAERVESFQQVTQRLRGCTKMIRESPWAGLTELTNQNGAECADSSPTQAWSAGCLIDLYHDAEAITDEKADHPELQMSGLSLKSGE